MDTSQHKMATSSRSIATIVSPLHLGVFADSPYGENEERDAEDCGEEK